MSNGPGLATTSRLTLAAFRRHDAAVPATPRMGVRIRKDVVK